MIIAFFFNSIDKVLENYNNAWIIGGEEIYNLFFPFVNKIYVTKVLGNYNCDKFFKIREHLNWKITYKQNFENYSFINYDRI
ncbi:MAG: hypothetical protein KatS3mg068_0075 [Candidatus Sericytochromatia bacterium]|nr:MAG: hypothetical protein KatS3mg068_0075 [Candidatus Sericytochromatia bacterium]